MFILAFGGGKRHGVCVGNPKLSKIAEVLPCTVVEMLKERFEVTQMVKNNYQFLRGSLRHCGWEGCPVPWQIRVRSLTLILCPVQVRILSDFMESPFAQTASPESCWGRTHQSLKEAASIHYILVCQKHSGMAWYTINILANAVHIVAITKTKQQKKRCSKTLVSSELD